ncbi:MAG: PIN domain-containing protein [Proteobacteria bacterium]|nr:PIN domain-containing protein [Pseudomonadota bacterium]MBU4469125.1 PIN domain-containing protein [Pseudomonadota bacterium]MCG2752156.1 PIN domain-containing protein [Desulfobacteraceae bacterium]
MPEFIMVDTDILIDAARGDTTAIECLQQMEVEFISIGLSAITQMELIVGCRNKKEIQHLDRFLDRFQIVHLDEPISAMAIGLLKRYRTSHGLLIADAIIAATATTLSCELISKNQKDFRYIKELKLLPYPKANT